METISEIITDMREFADADSQSIGRDVLRRRIQHFADSIEQAVTNCNQFKMREALLKSRKAMDEMSRSIFHGWIEDGLAEVMGEAQRDISSALAEPPRNCDRQYRNGYDVLGEFTAKTGRQIFETVDVVNWLFAEAKGENDD